MNNDTTHMESLSLKVQNGTATDEEKLELLTLLNVEFARLQAEVDAL